MTAAETVAAAIRDIAIQRLESNTDDVQVLASFLDVGPDAIEGLRNAERWELSLALMVADGLSIRFTVETEFLTGTMHMDGSSLDDSETG